MKNKEIKMSSPHIHVSPLALTISVEKYKKAESNYKKAEKVYNTLSAASYAAAAAAATAWEGCGTTHTKEQALELSGPGFKLAYEFLQAEIAYNAAWKAYDEAYKEMNEIRRLYKF